MSDHKWCRDVPRDEAVRAAEDAAAVPAIQHRDLPEQVALLWASVGDLIGRVVRLEGEMDAGQDDEADAASDEAVAHGATLIALAEARESLAAANRGIARLTAERDAAIRERDAARARVAELEAAAPPRGWLTEEERELIAGLTDDDDYTDEGQNIAKALLARSAPPKVKRPNPNVVITTVDARERIDRQWIAAIRAAGGEVEG